MSFEGIGIENYVPESVSIFAKMTQWLHVTGFPYTQPENQPLGGRSTTVSLLCFPTLLSNPPQISAHGQGGNVHGELVWLRV